MCCEKKQHRGMGGMNFKHHCHGGHSGKHFFRKFITKAEEKEYLENYKSQLKNEIEGIDERIKELEI